MKLKDICIKEKKRDDFKKEPEEINLPELFSDDEKLKRNDVLTLLALMVHGKTSNSDLIRELNDMGAQTTTPESAGHYRRKLENRGIVEGYAPRVNWEKVGYPVEFIVIVTTEGEDELMKIKKGNFLAIREYMKRTGTSIFIIPVTDRGDKVILKTISFGSSKRNAILSAIATSREAAVKFAKEYLPARYPDIKTSLFIVSESSIKDFEFQQEYFDSMDELLSGDDTDGRKYLDKFKEQFRWDLLKSDEEK